MNITEQRRKLKEMAYHTACIAQYLDSAKRLANFPRLANKALENARFHERKLQYLTAK